ncbi:MAG: hypothetical protein HZA95_00940 [Candidatus Vogelbacteria bacterium]|nr:hypothetical protein [Candidatus Vogelbacteria bacterium]
MLNKKGAVTLGSIMLSMLAATGSLFFPVAKTETTSLKLNTEIISKIKSSSETVSRPQIKTPIFKQVNWNTKDLTSSTKSPESKINTSTNEYLNNVFSVFNYNKKTKEENIENKDKIKTQIFGNQTFSVLEVSGGGTNPTAPLRGVNQLGNMRITHINTSNPTVRTSNFGGPGDRMGLTENIGGISNQTHIANGGTGLAMNWNQFNRLPPEFRLSPTDSRVVALTNAGVRPGAIGLLNPQASYVAIPDPRIPVGTRLIVTDSVTGYQEVAIKVDSGPGVGTGKGIDMSPGMEQRMGSGSHRVTYSIASDQNAKVGPVNGTKIPYDQPVAGQPAGSTRNPDGTVLNQRGAIQNLELGSGGEGDYPSHVGAWSSKPPKPTCYKHMSNNAGGSNQYDRVETCNSGYMCIQTDEDRCGEQRYVNDCGKRQTTEGGNDQTENLCEEEAVRRQGLRTSGNGAYACLWLACKAGNNAIWDPETKRCGCDDGKGGFSETGLAQTGPGEGEVGRPDDTSRGTEPTADPGRIGGSDNQKKLDDFNEEQKRLGTKARVVPKTDANGRVLVNVGELDPKAMDRATALASATNSTVVITSAASDYAHTSHRIGGVNFDVRATPEVVSYIEANGTSYPTSFGNAYVVGDVEYLYETTNPNASGPHLHIQNRQPNRPGR